MSPSELNRDIDYEDKLVAQMIKHHLFDGKSPAKAYNNHNKGIAPLHIEESLLNNNGNEASKGIHERSFCTHRTKKITKSHFYCDIEKSKYP